jgi:hypothetical protein
MKSPDEMRDRRRYRRNGERSPDEIEAEIARTRAEMDETLHAIERKLSPGELLDQAMAHLRNGPGDYAAHLGEAVKRDPLPVALIGLGVGWLVLSDVMGTSRYGRGYRVERRDVDYSQAAREEGGGIGEAIGDAARRAGAAVRGVRERAGEMGRDLQQRAGDLRERAEGRAHELREQAEHLRGEGARFRGQAEHYGSVARYRGERASNTLTNYFQEQPLVLGAVGVAVGALLAAVLPATRREDEVFGEARDRFVDETRVKDKAEEEGLTDPSRLTERMSDKEKSAREESGSGGPSLTKDREGGAWPTAPDEGSLRETREGSAESPRLAQDDAEQGRGHVIQPGQTDTPPGASGPPGAAGKSPSGRDS